MQMLVMNGERALEPTELCERGSSELTGTVELGQQGERAAACV